MPLIMSSWLAAIVTNSEFNLTRNRTLWEISRSARTDIRAAL